MGSTVASKYLSEHMTALKLLFYQFVTASLRLIAEVLGLGHLRQEVAHTNRISGETFRVTGDAAFHASARIAPHGF
jgi:hypothetical protein